MFIKINSKVGIKTSKYSILLFIILLVNYNFFYFFESSDKIFGTQIKDITLLIEIFFITYVCVLNIKKFLSYKYSYGFLISCVLILAFTGSYAASNNYAQPFLMGIRAHRLWISSLFMYFPISYLIKSRKYSLKQLLSVLYRFAYIYLAICTMQYFLASKSIFLKASYNYTYGNIKFYFDESLVVFLAIISLMNLYRKSNIKDAVFITWTLLFLGIVTKYRGTLMALIIATFITIFLSRGNIHKKIALVAVIAIAVYLFFTSGTQLAQSLMSAFSGQDSSFNTRDVGRAFYLKNLQGHYLLGYGYINIEWPRAYYLGGVSRGIYYVDNGLFGVLFYYGLVGITWFIGLFGQCFYQTFKVKSNIIKNALRIFLIMNVLVGITGMPNSFDEFFVFPVALVILEYFYEMANNKWKGNPNESTF